MKIVNCKILFFGTSEFAVPALEALRKTDYDITAVVTQSDKPVGRKQIPTPPPVKSAAQKLGLKVLQPVTLKNDEIFETFKLLNPDICIIAAYGKIIPKRFLDLPKYGFVNIHPSLLPKHRGPSPIQTAILNGDPALQRTDASGKINRSLSVGAGTETGISIIVIDEELDHGPILAQKTYNLLPTTYLLQAEKELAEIGAKLLIETLPKYINGEIKPQEQDHSQATFTKIFKREDSKINWTKSAEEICNQIRALNPEPGTWTTWHGKVINIPTSQVGLWISGGGEMPGTVRKIENDIAVKTGTGYLILKQIQLEGGKEIDAKEFINGHPDFLNSLLE